MEDTIVVNGVTYRRVEPVGPIVLVRTFSAGVHFGTLKCRNGKECELTNTRRLWSWEGACSLSQVVVDGVDLEKSKISIAIPSIILTEGIEFIPMAESAGKKMMAAPAWKK